MGKGYKKSKSSAGSKGVDFQIDLMSVFLLNTFQQDIHDWRLSTENVLAGKFDDVVLEMSDGGAILLQAKHKENRKITLDQLLSTDSCNNYFSLPKYFLSYLDIETKFQVKFLIICTNTQADTETIQCLNQNSVGRDSMLYYKDGASYFTFKDSILAGLIRNAKIYLKNNSKGKAVGETMITEEKAKEFLKHLQFYLEYPSGRELEKAIENILSSLKSSDSLLNQISYQDIKQKVKHWFEQPRGEYLTERGAGAMFCEIKSNKHLETLEDYKILFKRDFEIVNSSKRIFHVVTEGEYLPHLMKVYLSLQDSKIKILYADCDYGTGVQEQIIKAFWLSQYTHLLIVSPKVSDESVITEICVTLEGILRDRNYKKVVFVAERNNRLAQQIKSITTDYDLLDESLTLEDLSESTQEMLLKNKNVVFQGEHASLEELFPGQISDDYKKSIKSEILGKLVRGEQITVGEGLTNLEEEVSWYYVSRNFKRIVQKLSDKNEIVTKAEEVISEENIYNVIEKIILISDSAGMGKTTVLKNLARTIKKNNPRMWVIRIELNRCTNFLSDSLKNKRSINVWQLLHCKNSTKLTNDLEQLSFSLNSKVVLMLDGVDEISPDYTELILDLLLQSPKMGNLAKVFVTTRSHMARQLETRLNVTSFTLVPFSEQNQIEFLKRFWMYGLKLEDANSSKCEQYARSLVNRVPFWMAERHTKTRFVASPLHARMLAEVFLENKGLENWKGCKEYLSVEEVKPNLPEKINIAKLYKMFIEKKREIFIDKANPKGNMMAYRALKEQFEECLVQHRSLALEAILDERKCALFWSYKRYDADNDAMNGKVLNMGMMQKLDNRFIFVHRTLAEYFFAESLIRELQIHNQDVEFQIFLIDEVLSNTEFNVVRRFFDTFLLAHVPSLSSNIFKRYISDVKYTKNSNLIHRLAEKGYTQIIRLVLKCIDFKIIRDRVVFSYNCKGVFTKWNSLSILKYLVKRGGINIKDTYGTTPLHHAVRRGHLDTTKFLVGIGANLNSTSIDGDTPLHFAGLFGYDDIVSFLVKQGAHINAADKCGCTPLHCSAERGYCNIAEFLLKHGADINVSDEYGETPLHYAAKRSCFDVIDVLVKHGTDISIMGRGGYTPFHYAAERGHQKIVEFLVNCGMNINVTTEQGYTALHCAASYNYFRIAEYLIEHGVDINIADHEGNTALHVAAESGSFNMVEFLVKHNIDINLVNKEGCTVLHVCAKHNSSDMVELLVKRGVDINIANHEGNTALHFAVKYGSFNMVEFLVIHNADINVVNKEGYTVLHFAAECDHFDVVVFLVRRGVDINMTNRTGNTALQLAAKESSLHIVEFLAKHSTDINIAKKDAAQRCILL